MSSSDRHQAPKLNRRPRPEVGRKVEVRNAGSFGGNHRLHSLGNGVLCCAAFRKVTSVGWLFIESERQNQLKGREERRERHIGTLALPQRQSREEDSVSNFNRTRGFHGGFVQLFQVRFHGVFVHVQRDDEDGDIVARSQGSSF